jgi:energy-coupling factor transporter ATP-binding protein EcfA2
MENSIKENSNVLPPLEAEPVTDVDSMLSDDIEVSNLQNLKEEVTQAGYLPLFSGRALSLQETYNIMASENTALVVLVGPSESGKTTIETMLYQMFQRSKISNYVFAGSKTIQGYEERSFYTRITSRQDVATTPRTSRGSQELFLHLRLFDDSKKKKINYLFADLSGEEIYAHMANVESISQSMPFLKCTDFLTVILDGDRLINKNQRNGVIEEAATIIRTIFDAGLYSVLTKVQIVISKYDTIKLADDANTNQFIENNVKELRSLIQNYVECVTFHEIAAMPKNTSFDMGFGLEKLLLAWKYDPSYHNTNTTYDGDFSLKSEFNKLYYKLAGVVHE